MTEAKICLSPGYHFLYNEGVYLDLETIVDV